MSISSTLEDGIVINTINQHLENDTIFEYIISNIYQWKDNHTLWDVRKLKFKEIDLTSIYTASYKIEFMSKLRRGLKTAILVDSQIAEKIFKTLEILTKDKSETEIRIFNDQESAINWLKEE